MRSRWKTVAALSLAGVAALSITSCSNQTVRDLEGVPVKEPDKAEIYLNVDKFANVARECIDGVAFAFTTREYEPILRVPEWDDWCAE